MERRVSETVEDVIARDVGDSQPTVIEIRDAMSETSKVLVPQMGSDKRTLEQGIIDWRRFTNVPESQPLPMAWFLSKNKYQGGNFVTTLLTHYGNLRYSVRGEHKKIIVGFQKATSGARDIPKKRDERSWIQRNITQRGKKPEDEYYDI